MKALLHIRKRLIPVGAALVAAIALGLVTTPAANAYDSIIISGQYQVLNPDITCETDFDASGRATTKSIRIGDVTMFSPRSNQQASYQAILYRWTSTGWVKDWTLPETFGTTAGVMPNPYTITLPLSSDAYYSVVMVYRYYWNGVVEKSGGSNAATHQMYFQQDKGSITTMGFGATGNWCHMNVNSSPFA
jgi:hypothetical protein